MAYRGNVCNRQLIQARQVVLSRQLILGLAVWLVACSEDLPALDLRVIRGEVDLSRQVPGDWDRVCLLTPYTPTQLAAETTGLSTLEVAGLGIETSDRFHVLFFMRGEQVFAAYQVPRSKVDFAYNQPQCFARPAAIVSTRT